MNPFDFFERIYCINLDSREDRWRRVQKQFVKLGILDRVKRFSAVARENAIEVCRLSHQQVIRRALDHRWKQILVFEDDVVFWSEDLAPLCSAIHSLERIEWGQFFLGGLLKANAQRVDEHLLESRVTGMHAYWLSLRAYEFLLKAPKEGHIDHSVSLDVRVRQLYLSPPLCG